MATKSEWIARIARWKRSGLGANEFGARKGVDPKQLSWWKWHLKTASKGVGENREVPEAPKARGLGKTRLVPVRLAVGGMAQGARGDQTVRVEIATRQGHTIRIEGQVDPLWLTGVVRSLDEERSGC
jgi:hypothetical protein